MGHYNPQWYLHIQEKEYGGCVKKVTNGRPLLKTEALETPGVPTVLETGNNKITTEKHITSYEYIHNNLSIPRLPI